MMRLLAFALVVAAAEIVAPVRCQTSNNNSANKEAAEGDICDAGDSMGRCVQLQDFPEYAAILRNVNRSPSDRQSLVDRFCGYTSDRKKLACKPVKLNEPGCGIQLTDRITKGNVTGLEDLPWMALFQYADRKGRISYRCGGALINKRYVLSAAHCFVGLKSGMQVIKVRIGEWDIESDVDCTGSGNDQTCAPPMQEFDLERIMPHEAFSVKNLNRRHDIALVRLSGEVELSNFVVPICLPEPGTVAKRDRLFSGLLVASGWGKTDADSDVPGSRYKMYTTLHGTRFEDCKKGYATRQKITLADGQFCAQGDDGQDTCNGDSGGPLVKEILEQGRFFVTGVVSFGPKRCGQVLPGVYTDVRHYYKWIAQKLMETSR